MNIYTLIPDIQKLVERKDGWFTQELAKQFGEDVSGRLRNQFLRPEKTPTLRLSQMGPKCPCALWHSIHSPGEAEALPPWAEIKFAFGHIHEALLKAATVLVIWNSWMLTWLALLMTLWFGSKTVLTILL